MKIKSRKHTADWETYMDGKYFLPIYFNTINRNVQSNPPKKEKKWRLYIKNHLHIVPQ